jgi:tripartite-type tricarboxylate transporter receptor subunit TctC
MREPPKWKDVMRTTLRVSMAAVFALFAAAAAWGQGFPAPGKPVRLLVGFAAGGGTDIQARLLAPKLGDALGTTVVVENRPGASTMLAAQEVARAAPDGHTLLYTFSGTMAQNPHTLANVPYDPFRDFTPLSLAAVGHVVLVAHASLPATDIASLVAWGRGRTEPIPVANYGVGTSAHVFAEMLARQTGLAVTHVPYKGSGDAYKDLLAGRVLLMFDAATSALPQVQSGRVRLLGVVGTARSPFLPDVPTIAEQGLRGIDLTGWLAVYGPARMPPDVVERVNAAFVQALATPEVKQGFARGAYEATSSTPAELAKWTRDSYDRWGEVVRDLGIAPQ